MEADEQMSLPSRQKHIDKFWSAEIDAQNFIARNSEPLPLAKRDETLPCALFLFIGKCMEMIV